MEDESNHDDAFVRDEAARERRWGRLELAALVWPVGWGMVSLGVLLLAHVVQPRSAHRGLFSLIAFANTTLAVAGSMIGGVVAARDHQRLAAAVGFAIWAVLAHLAVFSVGSFFLELFGF